jgi:hypothetical protein
MFKDLGEPGQLVARAVWPDGTVLWSFFSVISARDWLEKNPDSRAKVAWVEKKPKVRLGG